MKPLIVSLLVTVLLVSCKSKPSITAVQADRVTYTSNTLFKSFEDLASPRFDSLRKIFRPDTCFKGEQDEFKRILLLRNWISGVIKISDFEPKYPGEDYADRILYAALQGQGFHCGHYMVVQNAVMNAYGYITRCIGAGSGVKGGPDGHHGANEIWSNTYQKWFLSDAKYNHHFEKNGVPLSALEVRDEYLKNGAKGISMVKGPDSTPLEFDLLKNAEGKWEQVSRERFAQTFTWIEWELSNDRFVHWPNNSDALAWYILYKDDYSTKNTWIWDGKPHWAYAANRLIPVEDRKQIEWTPDVTIANTSFKDDLATIRLQSTMPNLASFQIKTATDTTWKNTTDSVVVSFSGSPENIVLRAVNLAGVAGRECTVSMR